MHRNWYILVVLVLCMIVGLGGAFGLVSYMFGSDQPTND